MRTVQSKNEKRQKATAANQRAQSQTCVCEQIAPRHQCTRSHGTPWTMRVACHQVPLARLATSSSSKAHKPGHAILIMTILVIPGGHQYERRLFHTSGWLKAGSSLLRPTVNAQYYSQSRIIYPRHTHTDICQCFRSWRRCCENVRSHRLYR